MDIIPVIGTAIVNGAHWVDRLLKSVDYPVENFVIFNNNGRDQITKELENIVINHNDNKFIKKIHLVHMPSNFGCGGTWNLIIKSFITSPYWIITNHDIAFTEGFLKRMVELSNESDIGIVHGQAGDFNDGGWDLFLIKDWVIQSHGLFDENLYPAYGEDVDYIMRLKHNPIKRIYSVDIPFLHGYSTNYYEGGGQTKKEEPILCNKLLEINLINFEYLSKKWGPHWRSTWPYIFPFNNETLPISYTTYDIEYVRKKHLGF